VQNEISFVEDELITQIEELDEGELQFQSRIEVLLRPREAFNAPADLQAGGPVSTHAVKPACSHPTMSRLSIPALQVLPPLLPRRLPHLLPRRRPTRLRALRPRTVRWRMRRRASIWSRSTSEYLIITLTRE
jgi:hypothetical protein